MSLREVAATELADDERIISRLVNGSWLTGASDLDRSAVVEFLMSNGFEMYDEDRIEKSEVIWIEKFRLTTL